MKHRFAYELPVRFADTDQQGHVFFANYLTYCDEALTGYLRAIGCPWQRMIASGVDMFYRHAEVEFRGRARFEDRLAIHTRITKFGDSSFESELAVYAPGADEPVAIARLTSVCVDAAAGHAIRAPDMLREAVAAWESVSASKS